MALGGILKTGGIVLAAAALGAGGMYAAQYVLPHPALNAAAAAPVKAPPKPIVFADISDIMVSIPPTAGAPATSYLQFAVQFATTDPNALVVFAQLQPIIKADIINLLMNETGSSLQDPQTRTDLMKNCLDISNDVLDQKANYAPPSPFTAAYITNLVVQD
jgi:flagellar basal body-associated protein FliL